MSNERHDRIARFRSLGSRYDKNAHLLRLERDHWHGRGRDFWMEINKNIILRELKRLELQVARLGVA